MLDPCSRDLNGRCHSVFVDDGGDSRRRSAIEISRRGIYGLARSQLRRLLASEKVLLNNKFFSSNGRLGPSLLVYPALAHNVGLTFRRPLVVLYCADRWLSIKNGDLKILFPRQNLVKSSKPISLKEG